MDENQPQLTRAMFPECYKLELFKVGDKDIPESEECTGYAALGDWLDPETDEKEWSVSIYFLSEADAEAAAEKLIELGWDAWVEGL